MSSAKQIAANQKNALKSTGPKTTEGKAIVRLNALKHGATATTVVVPFLEHDEDWEAHRQGIVDDYAPSGTIETILAERIAMLLWRLGRTTRYEREVIAVSQETLEAQQLEIKRIMSPEVANSVGALQDEFDHHDHLARSLRRLLKLADYKKIGDFDAVTFIQMAAEAQGVNLKEFPLPGLPTDEPIADLTDWTAKDVRQAITAIAEAGGLSFEELHEDIVAQASMARTQAFIKLEAAKQELDRKRRERLLPDQSALNKISRYEAHLERSLYKAMRELERLQTARQAREQAQSPVDSQKKSTKVEQNGFVLQKTG